MPTMLPIKRTVPTVPTMPPMTELSLAALATLIVCVGVGVTVAAALP